MSQQFSMRGAVDLGALARRSAPSEAAPPAGPIGTLVRDVTEATFERDVIEMSMTVPVIIDLWAEWCEPCKALSPILEQLVVADAGRWLLAKIDIDAEQRIGQAFQVQSIPAVFVVLKGQPIPLFQGAQPAPQVRRYLDEVFRVAAEQGITGRVPGSDVAVAEGEVAPAPEPPLDPRLVAAYDGIENGDWDAAAAAYRELLVANPADGLAKAGLGQVELLRRTDGRDLDADIAAGDAVPDDCDAVLRAADAEVASGRTTAAFDRLISLVRRTFGPDRNTVRLRLLDLFEVVGEGPEVAKARPALAAALF
jgi:putative thioredoxin